MSNFNRDALISDVQFNNGSPTFTAEGVRYCIIGGGVYANHAGGPVLNSRDGSYAPVDGHTFGELMANASLLGARVVKARPERATYKGSDGITYYR